MATVSEITAFISVFLLMLGIIFVVWKVIHKQSEKKDHESSTRIYAKIKKPLYILHLSASAIGSIISIVHGITAEPVNLTCKISGDIVIVLTHIMFIMGIIMGVKNKMQPYGSELDTKYQKARIVKWILTGITIIALTVHFFAHFV